MRRFLILVATIMLAMLLLPAVPAAAAPPLGVTITVEEVLVGEVPEDFDATGDAVDAGLMCATGTVVDLDVTVLPSGQNHTRLIADKEFTCEQGTFTARLWVKLFPDGSTVAKWRITGGTSDFATLRGWGKLVGTPIFNADGVKTGITDVYTGKLKG